ncbi:aminopeptidase [Capsulimonas corticalis]|uniref:Aminopeptidase n=1 Tax=Capsulimonas corticalis TaxID=2219043 RepID=A0A402CUC1_9BACT|nr:aminopeptidase [Capsulimonas corticalis]BDI28922.1 aminopeptidase [Capsulimonas corticalis]
MRDPRVARLAEILVTYSTKVQPGEKVLIEAYDIPNEVVSILVDEVAKAGGLPFVTLKSNAVLRSLFLNASEEQIQLIGKLEKDRMEAMDVYIGVRGSQNISEHSDIPDEKMKLYRTYWWHPVHSETRVPKTKWCVLRWPTASMAQQAGKSTEAFEDFYFDVCTFDYARLYSLMAPLKSWMDRTDRVRLTGPNTNLSFSIKNIPTVACTGECNIPDGECFTAPVRNSVNGVIAFNTPTIYQGTVFEGITLTFKDGKIVEATAAGGNTDKLNQILDSDEGARYVGEFSLGFNPYVLEPMKDILFDEKIAGSFHFTPGQAYEEADNTNRSSIHWDMVYIQRPEFGGGEIWFDDTLIRKDGLFVAEDLKGLNPEELKAG